jgi:hypothetical protein
MKIEALKAYETLKVANTLLGSDNKEIQSLK